MSRIALFFWGLVAVVSGVWFAADSLWVSPFAYFPFRSVFVQYSGILAVVMMAVALGLALRLRVLERWVGGLDKVYRLHKWLGIGSLVLATLHWWWAKGTKWMVGWGWLEKPSGKGAGQQLTGLEAWFRSQRGLAETLGEWAFYAAALLIVLALVKAFPYHLFRKTHKLLAVVFLPLAWHSFTPFIARMGRLAGCPDNRTVYLFHPTADVNEEALAKLRADAEAAGVNLVIRCSRTEGRLTPEEIRDAVPDWQQASLWFCGPVGLAKTPFSQFRKWGMPAKRMHREFFDMR